MSTLPQAVREGKGHEEKDADVASLVLIGLVLLLLLLLVQLIVWMTLRHLRANRNAKEQGTSWASERSFPDPRLQTDPALDLAKMRAHDDRELNTYGWIDRKSGIARIPIERAMQIIAERGLPDVGGNQTPLRMMQGRPAARKAPAPHKVRY